MNSNTIHITGRIALKPELKPYNRKSDGKEGHRFFSRVAVCRNMDRGKKFPDQRTSFIPIVCWGDAATRHAQYLDVGTEVQIRGELVIEPNRLADGTFGPDFVSVQMDDVQYGRRSDKNATIETLTVRRDALMGRIDQIQAALDSKFEDKAPAPAPTTVASSTGGNPFPGFGGGTPAPVQ
jgi:single-stranded DNA-binding protein